MTVKLQKNGTVTVQKRSVKQNWYEQIVQYLRNVNLVKLSFASMVWNWNHKITSKTRLAKWTRGQTWFLWQNSSAPPSYTSSSTWCLLGDYWFIDWFLKGRRLQRVVENHLKSSGYLEWMKMQRKTIWSEQLKVTIDILCDLFTLALETKARNRTMATQSLFNAIEQGQSWTACYQLDQL